MGSDTVTVPKKARRNLARHVADFISVFSTRDATKAPATKPERIGILAQWGIGDAVLTLPLIHGLKEAYPCAIIEVIGKPWLADLLADDTAIDGYRTLVPPWTNYAGKYLFWQRDWALYLKSLRAIRRQSYDWIVGSRFDVRDNLQLHLINPRMTVGFASAGGRRWIDRDLGLDLDGYNALHRSEASAHVLKILTGLVRSPTPRLIVSDEVRHKALDRLQAAGYVSGPIVAVHGGAGRALRRWKGERFSEVLAKSLPAAAFVVVITDDEGPDGYGIRPPPGTLSTLWRSSLTDLKGLLACADVILCADSGVMHMAAACGCRVVTVFGPTAPKWFGPSGEGHHVVKVEPMPCRPCFDACIYAHPICMDSLSSDPVANALRLALGKTDRSAIRRWP